MRGTIFAGALVSTLALALAWRRRRASSRRRRGALLTASEMRSVCDAWLSTAADDAQLQRSQYDENVGRQEWPLTAAGQDTSSAQSRDESRRVPEAKDNESTCVICCEQKPAMACIPCGHMCMCPACADTFESQRDRRCPVCREFVASTMRVYT